MKAKDFPKESKEATLGRQKETWSKLDFVFYWKFSAASTKKDGREPGGGGGGGEENHRWREVGEL